MYNFKSLFNIEYILDQLLYRFYRIVLNKKIFNHFTITIISKNFKIKYYHEYFIINLSHKNHSSIKNQIFKK